ncbi:MAG: amidohydrolase [Steroidobacteraceae bacterium]
MRRPGRLLLSCALSLATTIASGEPAPDKLERMLQTVDPHVSAWRRDIHQNPELGNREFRTSGLVADELRTLGLEVQTGVAHTGVVGLLRGGRPGPTILLRADMDALPVVEQTDVPFKSHATGEYLGERVGVMHACGHDGHTAVLLGVAEAFSKLRSELPGNVVFLFQPAEEGPPAGEDGGASLVIKEGIFEKYRPAAAFGLHLMSMANVGVIGYRSGALMAGADSFRIVVNGRQTHGARPWQGVDPVVVAAQIVTALQSIVSRQVDITENPAVVTIGTIRGGVRHNIVPDQVQMTGTLRTFSGAQREDIMQRIRRTVENTAAASGATATFELIRGDAIVTYNDPNLTERVLPSLKKTAGVADVRIMPLVTVSEDFAFYGQKVPSFFFFVGVVPPGQKPATAAANHSPLFYVDERALPIALRALANVAFDYLRGDPAARSAGQPQTADQ